MRDVTKKHPLPSLMNAVTKIKRLLPTLMLHVLISKKAKKK